MFHHRLVLLLSFVLFIFFTSYFLLHFLNKGQTLGTVDIIKNVTVTASIPLCPEVIITPEKRIPPTHNNSLEIAVDIRPRNGTNLYSGTVTTDNEGHARLCPLTNVPPGTYDILIKGLSHLRRIFPNINLGNNSATLDLTTPVLFAGDSHPSADNYVNSLDIAYEINHLYGSDLRADLNRDTIVNSLEFPTLISHLYQHGDN